MNLPVAPSLACRRFLAPLSNMADPLPVCLAVFLSLGLCSLAPAQDAGDRPRSATPPVVVTASRLAQDPLEAPFSIDLIDASLLQRRSYRTLPQALRDVPGVMVQETSHGQGSPYIRGFTGFQDLLLIDGIRLNNSAFRSGPNQYWNTVDAQAIERIELVKGPSSVLYGSDAIGGTVNVLTRSPHAYADTPGFAYGGRAFARYATAEDSLQARAEVDLAWTHEDGGRTGVLLGGTAKAFGDLEGGRSTGTQPETGYEETDFDVKLEHWFDERVRLVFLHQNVAQNDVPRTHSTVFGINWRGTTNGSDLRRSYDQNRQLTYLQLHAEDLDGVFDGVHASVSWHRQKEVRDRIRGNGNQEFEGFDIGTLGLSLQLDSSTPVGWLTYGVEYYRDDVDSFFRRVVSPQPGDSIQGPIADDATYDLLGAYVQDRIALGGAAELTLGGRFNHAAADADSVRDPATGNRVAVDDHWNDFVGSARLLYRLLPQTLHLFGGVSQGFRAPNFSDLTRFDTARSNEFEIPATSLDPEHYVSYEIGLKAQTADVNAQGAFFYTDIDDQILRFPTGNVNGSGDAEITKANIGDGHVYGVELAAGVRVLPQTTLFGNFTFLEGQVTNFESPTSALADDYLTRLMPLTVQVGLRYEDAQGRFWGETTVVHAADADKLSFGDRRDTDRIPPGGTPGYDVWNVRGGWQVTDRASLAILLENITDVDYRVHGSGQNQPGRNLILAFETTF